MSPRTSRLGAHGAGVKSGCRSDWKSGPGVVCQCLSADSTDWVAGGTRYSYKTDDGKDWTTGTALAAGDQMLTMAYGNGWWTSLGINAVSSFTTRGWRSSNGLEWTEVITSGDVIEPISGTYGHDLHVHFGRPSFFGYTYVFYSADDGETWDSPDSVSMGDSRKIVSTSTGFLIWTQENLVDHTFLYSTDAIEWDVTGGYMYMPTYVKDVTALGSRVVALSANAAWYSDDDATSWTEVEIPSPGYGGAEWYRMTVANNSLIALSTAGRCITSTDGETWEKASPICRTLDFGLFVGSDTRVMILNRQGDWNFNRDFYEGS